MQTRHKKSTPGSASPGPESHLTRFERDYKASRHPGPLLRKHPDINNDKESSYAAKVKQGPSHKLGRERRLWRTQRKAAREQPWQRERTGTLQAAPSPHTYVWDRRKAGRDPRTRQAAGQPQRAGTSRASRAAEAATGGSGESQGGRGRSRAKYGLL